MDPSSSSSRSSRALRLRAGSSGPKSRGPRRRPRARGSRTIVLLGIDGAGKSTTAAALAVAEREAGRPAVVLRNPSGRRWLARRSASFGTELPARWADRFETVVRTGNVLVSQVRARRRQGLVVLDRHLVCQVVLRNVRGLPPGRLLPWLSAELLCPDTVVVLDVPAEVARERIDTRGQDHESLEYLRAARDAYLHLARAREWIVVDATGATDATIARIEHAGGL